MNQKIKVLVVDDSSVMRKIIARAIEKDARIQVIGYASNGLQAIEAVRTLNPDVVTLDIEMPEMDGLSALRELRKEHKRLPVIMFSSLTHRGAQSTVMALTAGASDYVGKPNTSSGGMEESFKVLETELIPKIIGLAKRARTSKSIVPPTPLPSTPIQAIGPTERLTPATTQTLTSGVVPTRAICAVCIGVSTGGPVALMQLFSQFKQSLPVPIFIVQHMPPTFTTLLAARLSTTSLLSVKEPEDGEIAQSGMVYMAPGGFHMLLTASGTKTVIRLTLDPPENSCRPAADVLFRSAAEIYGSSLLGVVLTGMGSDGTKGCQVIKSKHGQVIAQDEESSVIWGMPGAVVREGLADTVLPLVKIADEIAFRARKTAGVRKDE